MQIDKDLNPHNSLKCLLCKQLDLIIGCDRRGHR